MLEKQGKMNNSLKDGEKMETVKKCDKIDAKNLDNRITCLDEMPLFLTVKDVEKALGIGRNKAYTIFKRADFPAIEIDGQLRVCKDDFLEWLRKQRR